MKNILAIAFLMMSFSLTAQTPVSALADELLLLNAGGVLRGVEFYSDVNGVKKVESRRSNMELYEEDKQADGALYLYYELALSNGKTADVDYHFDADGYLFSLSTNTYTESDEQAQALYDHLLNYLKSNFKSTGTDNEGWQTFEGRRQNYTYKLYLQMKEQGMWKKTKYIGFDMAVVQ
ncbi:hypothetical protein [Gilvibacter sediminis]|uniref:hypothetical protein n=1 Tax=Gilvibacter sediminis TaxID=379071 RepID=UPI002350364F|nr:hypothetical protein [Gilvibacter sediminis]MDC7998037.1 hypothetical protein [Gilvibacter sediminis]